MLEIRNPKLSLGAGPAHPVILTQPEGSPIAPPTLGRLEWADPLVGVGSGMRGVGASQADTFMSREAAWVGARVRVDWSVGLPVHFCPLGGSPCLSSPHSPQAGPRSDPGRGGVARAGRAGPPRGLL